MPYNGLMILLGRPSRFDLTSLLSGKAGEWFDTQLGRHGITRADCHITSTSLWCQSNRPIPEGTRTILSLGNESHYYLSGGVTSLDENRGSPYKYQDTNINVIASYAPQDAFDLRNYEDAMNAGDINLEEEINDKNYNKGHGVTSRRNYKFWLGKDIYKALRIHSEGIQTYDPQYQIYPSCEEVCDILLTTKDAYLHIDIEVDIDTLDITCFAFTYEHPTTHELITPIYIVPLRRYNYTCAYEQPHKIWQALAVGLSQNTVVTHNGHQFDLFVFTYKYRLPFSKVNFDTIIGMHRCFPEAEKSLGHIISLFTDLPYHKNDGIYNPRNQSQEMELWKYCGKDVFGMYLCRVRIEEYARNNKGMWQSILDAQESIVVYLTETFTGIRRDQVSVEELMRGNASRIEQVTRVLDCLCGRTLNVQSPKQVQQYLFNKKTDGGLALQPMAYGKVSKKTGKPSPKADEKSILKLQVKHNIASLAVILDLRRVKKMNSSLNINFWNPFGQCFETDNATIIEEENDND